MQYHRTSVIGSISKQMLLSQLSTCQLKHLIITLFVYVRVRFLHLEDVTQRPRDFTSFKFSATVGWLELTENRQI